MKKITKQVIKLLSFLISVLTRALKAGTKTLESIKAAAEKGSELAPILVDISEMLIKLQQKKAQLEALQGRE